MRATPTSSAWPYNRAQHAPPTPTPVPRLGPYLLRCGGQPCPGREQVLQPCVSIRLCPGFDAVRAVRQRQLRRGFPRRGASGCSHRGQVPPRTQEGRLQQWAAAAHGRGQGRPSHVATTHMGGHPADAAQHGALVCVAVVRCGCCVQRVVHRGTTSTRCAAGADMVICAAGQRYCTAVPTVLPAPVLATLQQGSCAGRFAFRSTDEMISQPSANRTRCHACCPHNGGDNGGKSADGPAFFAIKYAWLSRTCSHTCVASPPPARGYLLTARSALPAR